MKPAIVDGKCRFVGGHCGDCRTDPTWRRSVATPDVCPHGYTADRLPLGLGDVVEKLTGAMKIRSCGGCKKRKRLLNRIRLR